MDVAPLHPDEDLRLDALLAYEVLDTEDDPVFDELTELASTICCTPISLISLIDHQRQWFKSKIGLDVSETDRNVAFCTHAILQDRVFEVPNATEDSRFATNPLVTGNPDIRFYAGAPLITPNGLPIGTLCVIDRTPGHLTDEQRRSLQIIANQVVAQLEVRLHNRRLQRLQRAQENLFSVVAHDLRSPFNAILGISRMLAKGAQAIEPMKVAEMSKSILSSSLSCYQLLDELLQWSRQRMHATTIEPTTVNLSIALDGALELLQDALKLKQLSIERAFPVDTQVRADATLTKTVLRNLLSNAIKFSPENGCIHVAAHTQDQQVIISIQDDGAGIPAEVASALFVSATESQPGTAGELGQGLGLALCQEFLQMQGGRIWVDTECEQGTRICFTLPYSQDSGNNGSVRRDHSPLT